MRLIATLTQSQHAANSKHVVTSTFAFPLHAGVRFMGFFCHGFSFFIGYWRYC